MGHVDSEQLAALALADGEVTPDVHEHVAACDECREVVAALVDVRRAVGADSLVPPPPGLRDRVLAEAARPDADVTSLQRITRTRRRVVPAWGAGLAAAVTLLVGIGVGQVLGGAEPDQTEDRDPTVVAAADLTTVEGTDPRGLARVLQSDGVNILRVEADALGEEDALREVWLLNVDGKRMVALGLLAALDEGDFDVPEGLLDQGYRIVDISVEPDDGDPTHSGVSVARGELTQSST